MNDSSFQELIIALSSQCLARSRLDDTEAGGEFTADTLREMLDGISHLAFSEWW
jgi:hypothetical protein